MLLLTALLLATSSCQCEREGAASSELAKTVARFEKGPYGDVCEHRMGWPDRIRPKCTQCASLAPAPACGCEKDRKEFSGVCAKRQATKLAAKDCSDVWDCTNRCRLNDCECRAKCLAADQKCHDIMRDLEVCLVKTCEPYCRGDAE